MKITTEYVPINNIRQNLMTLSTDDSNPVLLIVHGGAGLPDRPLIRKYSAELSECYTVVCWDQRGAGFSASRAPLSLDIMLADLKAVVLYLLMRADLMICCPQGNGAKALRRDNYSGLQQYF